MKARPSVYRTVQRHLKVLRIERDGTGIDGIQEVVECIIDPPRIAPNVGGINATLL